MSVLRKAIGRSQEAMVELPSLESQQSRMTTTCSRRSGGMVSRRSHACEGLAQAHNLADLLQKRRLDAAASAAASGENEDNTAEARWQRGVTFATAISGPPDTEVAKPSDSRNAPPQRNETESSFKSKLKAAKEKAYNRDPVTGRRRPFNGQKGGQKAVKIKKELEEQHWLEMIDKKHRYGSNLKVGPVLSAGLSNLAEMCRRNTVLL
jgi:hypothetical protein